MSGAVSGCMPFESPFARLRASLRVAAAVRASDKRETLGLGNIWRFPYRVAVNGGGAFLLPYLLSILLFALPIPIFELGSGHRFRGGVCGHVLAGLAGCDALLPDARSGGTGRPLVWSTAFGQAFFSVGVGGGIMITYGAYVGGKENVGSSVIVTSADVVAAFIAGMVIFPIVFSYGGEPASGPKLAFDNLPLVFSCFPSITGYLLAGLFYLLLAVAALTSSISLLEAVLLAAESLGIRRKHGLVAMLGLLVLFGLPSALSYSGAGLTIGAKPFLDWADDLAGMWLLPLGVLITAVVLGWLAPAREMMQEVKQGFWGWLVLMMVRLAVPVAIVVVLVTTVVQELG